MDKTNWDTRTAIIRSVFLALEAQSRRCSTVDAVLALRAALTATLSAANGNHRSRGDVWSALLATDDEVAAAFSRWNERMSAAHRGMLLPTD